MRLTTVAQMSLSTGRLHSLRLRAVGDPVREVPVSFDQGRHVGAGDRPGSWMALAFRLPRPTTTAELEAAWLEVVARHGTLRTVFSRRDDGALRLHETEVVSAGWSEHPVDAGEDARAVLRAVLDVECRPFAAPSHLVCLVEPGDGEADRRPMCVIASDHAHVDMWSLAVLGRDVLGLLDRALPTVEGAASGDAGAASGEALPAEAGAASGEAGAASGGTAAVRDDGPPFPAFAEHTAALEAMPPAPDEVRRDWAAALEGTGGVMPAFPLPLGTLAEPREAVVEIRDVLGPEELSRFEAAARARGVRALSLATASLASVTRRLADAPLRAVFPVHSRFEERWRHSVGWFITNSILECDDADPVACAADVARAITLGGYPLAPLLAPYGGMVEPRGMFALSWLDVRRLPVALPAELEAQYVSAVISTDAVMIWFIVNTSGMHLRCRYPDTAEARDSLGRWLDALETDLKEHACAS
ncbi:peptide synthetase [Cnuibacter physcomitrellae]|uniref:peptide synthetase n=1 Tax=Cnuibacter physcomitrellae TaxID=1619308 RepID=UPI002176098F|nr:peptide synthetase [Cnuibacter physcomitrellae]MCS5498612.1 peptide synthetase [Cnuibacter physcomitrellae]